LYSASTPEGGAAGAGFAGGGASDAGTGGGSDDVVDAEVIDEETPKEQ